MRPGRSLPARTIPPYPTPRNTSPSCGGWSSTTPTATTCSTILSSGTTSTTRCSMSCGRWRPRILSCLCPTRPRSASGALRWGAWRRSRTWSRCSRSPTPARRLSFARGSSGCATTSRARASPSRALCMWSSRRSMAWRSRWSTATACWSGASRAGMGRSARTSPTTCAPSARSRCTSMTRRRCLRCGASCTCRCATSPR